MRVQILVLAAAGFMSIFAADKCRAQSQEVKVDIPFAFEVENQQMKSGSYRVVNMATGAGSLQVVVSSDGKARVIIPTIRTPSHDTTGTAKLIFHRYGDRYFLAEILNGDGHARNLFVSQKEKEVMRTQAKIQIPLLARASATKTSERHR